MSVSSSELKCIDASEALELQLSTKDVKYTPPCDPAPNVSSANQTKPKPKANTLLKLKKKKLKYHCAPCGYNGKSKKGITRHNNSKAHQNKIKKGHACLNCNVCKAKAFSDLTKCPLCGFTSSSMTNMKLHLNIHSKGKPFRCSFCKYTAQNVTDLIQHYKTVKKYTCRHTGCVFVSHIQSEFVEHGKFCKWKK